MHGTRASVLTGEVFHKRLTKKYLGERRLLMRLPSILFFRPVTSDASGGIHRFIFNLNLYLNSIKMNSLNIHQFLSDARKINKVISWTEYAKNLYASSALSTVKLKSFSGFRSGIGHVDNARMFNLMDRGVALSSGAGSGGKGGLSTIPGAEANFSRPYRKADIATDNGKVADGSAVSGSATAAAFPILVKSAVQHDKTGRFHEGMTLMRSEYGWQSFNGNDQCGIVAITRSSFINPSISSHRPKYMRRNDPRILSARQTDGASFTEIKQAAPAPMLCLAGLIQLKGVEMSESVRAFATKSPVLKRFGNTPLSYGAASVVTPSSSGRDYAEKKEAAFMHRSRTGFTDYAELKREVGEIRNSFADTKETVTKYIESVRKSRDSGKPDINVISDRVYRAIEQRLRTERQRRGF